MIEDGGSGLPWQREAVIRRTQQLLFSFEHWTGRALLDACGTPEVVARTLFEAPFAVVSHGVELDPIFDYGNQLALDLWQLDWEQFTQLPSRLSAEPIKQEERERMLNQVKTQGFISNYQGVRISSKGERFLIQDTIIWNVIDEQNRPCGQAATFSQWQALS